MARDVLFPTSVIGSLPRPRFVRDLIADDCDLPDEGGESLSVCAKLPLKVNGAFVGPEATSNIAGRRTRESRRVIEAIHWLGVVRRKLSPSA